MLFFLPYDFYLKHYAHSFNRYYLYYYYPHRARYYLYPVKVWELRSKYTAVAKLWNRFNEASKKKVLKNVDYILGPNIRPDMFPDFMLYCVCARDKEGFIWIILKRRK